jgi:transcription factor C subunit 6
MSSRPKRSRPSYAEIFQPIFSDEEKIIIDVAGKSDSEAGSVFDPTVGVEARSAVESPSDDELGDLADEENNGIDDDEEERESVVNMGKEAVLRGGPKSQKQGAKVVKTTPSTLGTQNLLSVSRPHRPGISVAPNLPSKDHRHRPNGLWAPPSDVHRLLSPPIPFLKSEVIRTNSADHPAVMQRVKKAWANSSGTGPVWELLEDRAFFKEEWIGYVLSSRKGRILRPVIFPTVEVQQPRILSRECVRSTMTSIDCSHSFRVLEMPLDTYLMTSMIFQPSKSLSGLSNHNLPAI